MTNNSLTLIPYRKNSFTIGLLEDDGRYSSIEEIVETSENNIVFSDLSYEFVLNYADISNVSEVRVYINDIFEPSTFDNGKIYFPLSRISDRRIFLDCYGFVEISFVLIMTDNTQRRLKSGYIPVLVRRSQLNDAVKEMVNYVYNHQETFLLNGELKPRDLSSLKENGYKNIATQIILAEEIAAIYEESYSYFKANSRFCIKKVPTIDRFEKLQYITPETLGYIVSHPEQFKRTSGTTGIRIGQQFYQPEKTLSLQNSNSFEIEENVVILGFLKKMVDEVGDLKKHCSDLIKQIPDAENYSAEYIYSSFFMFSETRQMLENSIKKLSGLYDKYIQLLSMYQNVFNIPIKPVTNKPNPTAVFLSIPQYNKIFVRIYKWFDFGIYDFAKEKFMLSFIKISYLYESYLLAKLISYFTERGYERLDTRRCVYPVSKKSKYKNTNCSNTFVFLDGNTQITVYYQPVIFDTDHSSVNGVGLYRNNSIPASGGEEDGNRQGGYYYAPDYIIKVTSEKGTKYLIADAKFSDLNRVKSVCVKDLAFKYLFSVSAIDHEDDIVGMCILYGKCSDQEQIQSAYDKQIVGNSISPKVELVPLMEKIGSIDQYDKLDSLFRIFLD